MYAGCVAGAIQKEEYMKMIEVTGFINIIIQKEKSILLPADILANYFSEKKLILLKKNESGIYSITVYAEKPAEAKSCCEPHCYN